MLGAVVYMYCRVCCRAASEYMSNTVPIRCRFMFLPNTHHVFTQYTVIYVMKPVEYMKGENLTENRGETWPYPVRGPSQHCLRALNSSPD